MNRLSQWSFHHLFVVEVVWELPFVLAYLAITMIKSSSGISKTALLCWLALAPLTLAGIQPYDLLLAPSDAFVHYNDGYISAPGYIDLGGLTFEAISSTFGSDDTYEEGGDDKFPVEDTDDTLSTEPPHRNLDGGIETDSTAIDIVVFLLPRSCVRSKNGCDWADLGVGKKSNDGVLRWCCSQEAIDLGICNATESQVGRLMLDPTKFKGNHRFVTVPADGPMSKQIRYGKMEEKESGTYVVIYANCNEHGRTIYVKGESVWKSKHGFLPGELYGFMFFFTAVTLLYFALLVWYGVSMYVNEESRIEIEKWIFLAICLGLLEMIFRTGDYYVWNADGYRSDFIIWVGILAGTIKQGISRCLIVMVSLGWGVVRDTLGSQMRVIIILGAAYIGVSAVRDLMIVFAIEDVNTLSFDAEEQIFDIVKFLTLVVSAINVIFIMWILDALNNTMLYLENMNQSRKLERYLKFRCLFLISMLFAIMWAVFTLVDTVNDDGIVEEEHAWLIEAATEVNYLFVLVGVAYLWRPNPSAREYAFVMELPAMGDDGDNELELTGSVPSAMDSDDGSAGKNGFHDEHDVDDHDHRFQIS